MARLNSLGSILSNGAKIVENAALDQHVDRPELSLDQVGGLIDGREVRDVGSNHHWGSPRLFDLVGCGLQAASTAGDQCDVGSGRTKFACHGAADACTGSCDDNGSGATERATPRADPLIRAVIRWRVVGIDSGLSVRIGIPDPQ